jgi:hypothetical protein
LGFGTEEGLANSFMDHVIQSQSDS